MDGTYNSTLSQRLNKTDLVIFLDYSSLAHVKGVLERYSKHKGKEKQEISGCNEKMSLEFLHWVVNWRKKKRLKILNEINKEDNKKVLFFKNREKSNKWFENEFSTKIEID